jgi:hypothetical protein
MSIEQMRESVKNMYPGEKWHRRVSKMSNRQIMAIYFRHLNIKKAN